MTRRRSTNLAVIPDATGTPDRAAALNDIITPHTSTRLPPATRTRLHHDAGLPEPRFLASTNR
jgi:hypothetical protein